MKKNLFVFTFVFCFFLTSYGQTDYRKGYIITNESDTIRGLIDYRGDIRNMKICSYKSSENTSPIEYYPTQIAGYRFDEGRYFVSKYIKQSPISDTVFVEFLVNGINNLFFFNNVNYSAYFIESSNGELMELKASLEKKVEIEGRNYMKKDNRYIGLLTYAFSDCPELKKEIQKTDLTHNSLISLTKKYHEYKCSDEACIIYQKRIEVLRVEIQPFIGYAFSHISFENSDLENIEFQMSHTPLIGLSLNFIIPRINEKISLLLNSTFNKDYFYGQNTISNSSLTEFYYYHLHKSNLNNSIAIQYTYPKGRIRPECFIGGFGNIILDSDCKLSVEKFQNQIVRTYNSEYDLFNKTEFGYLCGIGAEYHIFKNLKGFTNFIYLFSSQEKDYNFKANISSFRLTLGITF